MSTKPASSTETPHRHQLLPHASGTEQIFCVASERTQRIANIVKLTTDHVHDHGDRIEIMPGTAPTVLPEPLG
jgi:hypothetical protein